MNPVDVELIERLGAWTRSVLAPLDVALDAPIHLVKHRPWSTVLVVDGPAGRYFGKANCAGQSVEPVLLRRLAAWVPDAVVEPLAIDANRAWMVLPDGGQTIHAMQLHQNVDAWAPALAALVRVQRAALQRGRELVRLGVPDFHPRTICDRLRWIGDELSLPAVQLKRIRMLADQLEPISIELVASPFADGLSHGDLHANNLFAPPTSTPFDWGDAVVGHPFCTLSNLRMSLNDDDFYFILRDRYLAAWRDAMNPVELRREADHAEIAGCVAAIWTWLRIGPDGIALHPNSIPSWIDQLETLLRQSGAPN
jgi:Phosphotransferase enzyme family